MKKPKNITKKDAIFELKVNWICPHCNQSSSSGFSFWDILTYESALYPTEIILAVLCQYCKKKVHIDCKYEHIT